MDLNGARMLAAILAVGTGVWLGGFVTVAIVSASSSRTVTAADRVALFRTFGRRFAAFLGVAALFVVLPALALAVLDPGVLTTLALVLALSLLLVTSIGILQARRMSALRGAAASGEDDPAGTRRNASAAVILRSLIGLVSLALAVLALLIASQR